MKKLLVLILLIPVLLLTGCNKSIIDTTYTFDRAICKIGDEYSEIKIKEWKDYEDGEQLQLIDRDNHVYLVSSVNCTLIKD